MKDEQSNGRREGDHSAAHQGKESQREPWQHHDDSHRCRDDPAKLVTNVIEHVAGQAFLEEQETEVEKACDQADPGRHQQNGRRAAAQRRPLCTGLAGCGFTPLGRSPCKNADTSAVHEVEASNRKPKTRKSLLTTSASVTLQLS